MSLLRRNELRVSIGARGLEALPEIPRGARVTAVVSGHHARYALLPWSPRLASEEEWLAYARHRFTETYGAQASDWDIRVSPSPRRAARLACGLERALLDDLRGHIARAGAQLASVRPLLMDAFNARRKEFRRGSGWLVIADESRLTLALIVHGLWELVRVRNVGPTWREELAAIVRREELLAKRDVPVERIVLA